MQTLAPSHPLTVLLSIDRGRQRETKVVAVTSLESPCPGQESRVSRWLFSRRRALQAFVLTDRKLLETRRNCTPWQNEVGRTRRRGPLEHRRLTDWAVCPVNSLLQEMPFSRPGWGSPGTHTPYDSKERQLMLPSRLALSQVVVELYWDHAPKVRSDRRKRGKRVCQ